MHEDTFARNAKGISSIHHEVLLLRNFSQTKPQVKNMKITYYDLYYTVDKNGDEKEIVDKQYHNDYINFIDFIIPSHKLSIKPRDTILK